MKIKVVMKDPDSLIDAIEESIENQVHQKYAGAGLSTEELCFIVNNRVDEAQIIARKWFRYSEYLTVEIDTDEKTIRVVPVDENGD
jgi:hypothetical protein